MAEDTQEDLSMEDILSSIKDILLEDNKTQNQNITPIQEAQKVSEVSVAASVEKVEPDVIDDVFTLSPAMIVDSLIPADEPDAPVEVGADPFELDFEQEFENLPSEPVLDDVESEVLAKESKLSAVEDELIDFSDFSIKDSDTLNLDSEIDEDSKISFSDLNFDEPIIDVEAEPIYSAEDDAAQKDIFSPALETETNDSQSLESLLDDETLTAILEAQQSEPKIIEDYKEEEISDVSLENNFVEPTDNVYEAVAAEDSIENELEEAEFEEAEGFVPYAQEPITPTINEVEPILAPDSVVSPKLNMETKEVENISEDAVDISAGIINNFAKMFAETQKEKPTFEKEVVTQDLTNQTMSKIELGEGSLTIEEIVRDVVVEIVEKNLTTDFDFSATASAEIAKQTKAWLSANLPSIVESTVKKEIERVMAKVSS